MSESGSNPSPVSPEGAATQKKGRPCKLSDALIEQVTLAVAKGAYAHIAAEAGGIAPSTFFDWMRKGREGDSRFMEFSERVSEARAKARLRAEKLVFESDPKFWLRCGPGRERPGNPGWTAVQSHNEADSLESRARGLDYRELFGLLITSLRNKPRDGDLHVLSDQELALVALAEHVVSSDDPKWDVAFGPVSKNSEDPDYHFE